MLYNKYQIESNQFISSHTNTIHRTKKYQSNVDVHIMCDGWYPIPKELNAPLIRATCLQETKLNIYIKYKDYNKGNKNEQVSETQKCK